MADVIVKISSGEDVRHGLIVVGTGGKKTLGTAALDANRQIATYEVAIPDLTTVENKYTDRMAGITEVNSVP